MGKAKIIFGDQVLQDLTQDTITPEVLMEGYTAHAANGDRIVGTAIGGTDDYEQLTNQPQINNVTLIGNKSLSDLGAVSEDEMIEELYGVNLLTLNLAELKKINTAGTWSGNNYTIGEVTFTINANNTITANSSDTATKTRGIIVGKYYKKGTYIYSGCPSGGGNSTYKGWIGTRNSADTAWNRQQDDTGSGVTVNITDDDSYVRCEFEIRTGYSASNLVFKPMLYKGNLDVPDFHPYNEKSIQHQLNNQTGILGAKNFLKNSWGAAVVQNVSVITNPDDGTLTLNGGPASASQSIQIFSADELNSALQKYGDLILSGPPKTDGVNTCIMFVRHDTNQYMTVSEGNELLIPAKYTYDNGVNIQYYSGKTYSASKHKFYPMIRLASDPDNTYQPYVMTNKELTDDIVPLISSVSELLKISFRFILPSQAKTKVTIKNAKNQTTLLFVFGQYGGRKQGLFAISRMFDDSISVTPYFNDGIVIDTNMIIEKVGENDLDVKFPTFLYGTIGYGIFVMPSINSYIETGIYT